MVECTEQLVHNLGCLLLVELGHVAHHILNQLAALTQLHAKIDAFLVFICFEVVDNIGMVDLLNQSYFIMDAINFFFRQAFLVDGFNCKHLFGIFPIYSLIDGAKGSFSKNFRIKFVGCLQFFVGEHGLLVILTPSIFRAATNAHIFADYFI